MEPLRQREAAPVALFCFACPPGFSGQKAATELVISGLEARGWNCLRIEQPVQDRAKAGIREYLKYGYHLLGAWWRAFRLLRGCQGHLCVNLGQTPSAFVRDFVPLVLGRLLLGKARVVISLHGSVFMSWRSDSLVGRAFRFLLNQAGTVTVLGERQKAKLAALGVSKASVKIVVNSCAVRPLDEDEFAQKYERFLRGERPLRVLHLSSLIATKGFPEYLDALEALCAQPGVSIEAVLCGKVTPSEFQNRFHSATEAENWIEARTAFINQSKSVRVEWLRGATGEPKERLFHRADVFVLPTQYAVEAQPLVLLEAMAAGCCILTTDIGEIRTILDEQCAWFLTEASAQAVEEALHQVLEHPSLFARLARGGHERYVRNYALDRHLDAWEALLGRKFQGGVS